MFSLCSYVQSDLPEWWRMRGTWKVLLSTRLYRQQLRTRFGRVCQRFASVSPIVHVLQHARLVLLPVQAWLQECPARQYPRHAMHRHRRVQRFNDWEEAYMSSYREMREYHRRLWVRVPTNEGPGRVRKRMQTEWVHSSHLITMRFIS